MKINLKQTLVTERGQPILLEGGIVFTLGELCGRALLSDYQEEHLDVGEKVRRYRMWKNLDRKETVDLPVEDVALLKRLIGIGWGPLIVGQAFDMLEQ